MDERPALARRGEALAAELYESAGFTILDRNWRCREGELDIVAARCDLVVFCEVKTRRSAAYGLPSEAVGARKQNRLRRLAARWLAEARPGAVEVRFDVVSVIEDSAGTELTLIPDAF